MNDAVLTSRPPVHAGVALPASQAPRLPVFAFGMSLGTFLAVTYLLCVLFGLGFPEAAMNSVWSPLLPGFSWLDWPNFFLGLIETIAYGWYVALIFCPLFNFFAARWR